MHRNDSEVLVETCSVYDPATNSRTKRFLFSFNSGSNKRLRVLLSSSLCGTALGWWVPAEHSLQRSAQKVFLRFWNKCVSSIWCLIHSLVVIPNTPAGTLSENNILRNTEIRFIRRWMCETTNILLKSEIIKLLHQISVCDSGHVESWCHRHSSTSSTSCSSLLSCELAAGWWKLTDPPWEQLGRRGRPGAGLPAGVSGVRRFMSGLWGWTSGLERPLSAGPIWRDGTCDFFLSFDLTLIVLISAAGQSAAEAADPWSWTRSLFVRWWNVFSPQQTVCQHPAWGRFTCLTALCVFTGFGEHTCMSLSCIVGNMCSIFEKHSTGPKWHSLTLTHNATQRVSDITGGSLWDCMQLQVLSFFYWKPLNFFLSLLVQRVVWRRRTA